MQFYRSGWRREVQAFGWHWSDRLTEQITITRLSRPDPVKVLSECYLEPRGPLCLGSCQLEAQS